MKKKKRVNTKAKGNRRERQAKKILEEQGYLVTKAGGSLGIFDLVALSMINEEAKFNLVTCVQVKSNRKPGKGEMEELYKTTNSLHKIVNCEVWIFHDYQKKIEVINLRKGT